MVCEDSSLILIVIPKLELKHNKVPELYWDLTIKLLQIQKKSAKSDHNLYKHIVKISAHIVNQSHSLVAYCKTSSFYFSMFFLKVHGWLLRRPVIARLILLWQVIDLYVSEVCRSTEPTSDGIGATPTLTPAAHLVCNLPILVSATAVEWGWGTVVPHSPHSLPPQFRELELQKLSDIIINWFTSE